MALFADAKRMTDGNDGEAFDWIVPAGGVGCLRDQETSGPFSLVAVSHHQTSCSVSKLFGEIVFLRLSSPFLTSPLLSYGARETRGVCRDLRCHHRHAVL